MKSNPGVTTFSLNPKLRTQIHLIVCEELFSCKAIKMSNEIFRSGIDVNNVIETAESFNETSKAEERSGQLSLMTLHMHR